jgi:capsular exopolysaccharide synthesis family protein
MESNNEKRSVKSLGKEISFQWFFMSFFIYWKWFLLSIIVFLLIGFFNLRYAVPVYNVYAKIMLKDSRRGGMSNSEISIFESMNVLEGSRNIENELEILTSRNLMESTVIAQELYIRYLVKGKVKDTELYEKGNRYFYSSSPVKVFVDTTVLSALQSTIVLKVSLGENDTDVVVNGFYGGSEFSGTYSFFPGVLMTPIGELLLFGNEYATLKKEYPIEIHISPPLWIAQHYMGALRVALTGENTTVVRMTLAETNCIRGEDFLGKLVELYNQDAMDDKNKSANSAYEFIEDRLSKLTFDLVDVEKSVESYKQQHEILSLDGESSIILGGIKGFEKDLIDVETKRNLLSYLHEEFDAKEKNSQTLPAAIAGSLDGSLAAGFDRYNQLIRERDRLVYYTDEESPIIKRLDDDLRTTKENIRTNLQSVGFMLQHKQSDLENLRNIYDVDRHNIPEKERELAEIVRQQLIKANLFVDLLRKREEIALTIAVMAPSAKILESPLASYVPIAPRRMSMYMMCLLSGLVFPFIIIGIRELFNYKITNEDEVRRYIDVPIIVSLPLVRTKDALIITPHSTTAIAERFRLLRINLQHVLDKPDKKVVLVTSTISGEGKTFVSINLAMTFSLKFKTILVGLDIRRPKINIYLELPKKAGLISYLTGNETDLDKLINKNVQGSTLDVLVSGIVPPNPNELLMEKSLEEMFTVLREKYDYIIIDTSPIGSVSDAFLVNRVSDASLFVIRGGLSPKSSLTLVSNVFREKRLNSTNVVLNAFDKKKSGRYGYGNYGYGNYSYGYGYGYGYGYSSE